MTALLIGIDDTDNPTSRGTGHLARTLLAECVRRGMKPVGVTRHQFLIDPAIPYTSHNSGACVAVAGGRGVEEAAFAFDFVAAQAAEGSDPGACIASSDQVDRPVIEFGRRAARQIVEMDDLDLISVCTSNDCHYPVVMAAIERGLDRHMQEAGCRLPNPKPTADGRTERDR
jgi:tRNA(Ile2) C34 agmatinyltransferase TiaS